MRAVEARRGELIALTQDLIRLPTLNPPGDNYLEICEYLAARLKKNGFATELIRARGAVGESDKYPRWNMVARIEGAHSGQCVHFNSHTDVVEVGRNWTYDPFGGALHDGKIYGRGSCDMKGGLAASIIAAEAFLEVCPDFAGAIEISATADEESGGLGGVAYLAEKGFYSPERVQYVIIPEPLNKDPDLPWASRRLVGRDRDVRRDRPWLDAVSGRLRGAPYGCGIARDGRYAVSRAGAKTYRHAGCA